MIHIIFKPRKAAQFAIVIVQMVVDKIFNIYHDV